MGLREPKNIHDTGGDSLDLLAALDDAIPDWRAVEVFGPPGSGKSVLCRKAISPPAILSTCDRQAVRFYSSRDSARLTSIAEAVLSRRRLRNFYSLMLTLNQRRYWKHADVACQEYARAVAEVREAFPADNAVMNRFDNRVYGSAPYIERAQSEDRRIFVDEGLLNQLNSLIARTTGGEQIGQRRIDLVRACLQAYPFEKCALLVEASPSTCVERQEERGHVLFSPDRPQSAFHDVAAIILKLCQETRWRTAVIRNEN